MGPRPVLQAQLQHTHSVAVVVAAVAAAATTDTTADTAAGQDTARNRHCTPDSDCTKQHAPQPAHHNDC